VSMFRYSVNSLVAFAIITATAFAGVVPVTCACDARDKVCGSEQCCGECSLGSNEPAPACCSASRSVSTKPHICQCSLENKRPVAPLERRNSDERDHTRRVESMVIALFVSDTEPRTWFSNDAPLFPYRSTSHRQAVLCRWLT